MSYPIAALLVVLLLASLASLALLAWFLIQASKSVALLMEAFLKQAQGLQALGKLKDLEDEKLQRIIDKFGAKPASANIARQIEEIRRKAEARGTVIAPSAPVPDEDLPYGPMTPPPEPADWDGAVVE